jgi:hypothetical protein
MKIKIKELEKVAQAELQFFFSTYHFLDVPTL